MEGSTTALDRGELQTRFIEMRSLFSELPVASRVRSEAMKAVFAQLGIEGEKLKKARKTDEEIFEEWLKSAFIPIYRRARK